jgi:hypothetical protein
VGQDAAGVEVVEPELELELEPGVDPEDPPDEELLSPEPFFGSALGVAGEVAEDLPRLSVR